MKLLLVGCGNMGKALLTAWTKAEIFKEIIIVQPSLSAQKEFSKSSNIKFVENELQIQ